MIQSSSSFQVSPLLSWPISQNGPESSGMISTVNADRRQVRLNDLRRQDPFLRVQGAQGQVEAGRAGFVEQAPWLWPGS